MAGDILIVDDNEDDRVLLRRILELEDAQAIREAVGGREAVQALQETTPDVMILDMRMPCMDGYEVLEWMARTRSLVPTIVMTGHVEDAAAKLPSWVVLAEKFPMPSVLRRLMGEARSILAGHVEAMDGVVRETKLCCLAGRIEQAAHKLESRRAKRASKV